MATMCGYKSSNYVLPHWKGGFVVVRISHGFIFQVYNQIITIQMLASPYVFMCINTFHFVLCMVDAPFMKRKGVNYVGLLYMQV